jgi:hypothetical protein
MTRPGKLSASMLLALVLATLQLLTHVSPQPSTPVAVHALEHHELGAERGGEPLWSSHCQRQTPLPQRSPWTVRSWPHSTPAMAEIEFTGALRYGARIPPPDTSPAALQVIRC